MANRVVFLAPIRETLVDSQYEKYLSLCSYSVFLSLKYNVSTLPEASISHLKTVRTPPKKGKKPSSIIITKVAFFQGFLLAIRFRGISPTHPGGSTTSRKAQASPPYWSGWQGFQSSQGMRSCVPGRTDGWESHGILQMPRFFGPKDERKQTFFFKWMSNNHSLSLRNWCNIWCNNTKARCNKTRCPRSLHPFPSQKRDSWKVRPCCCWEGHLWTPIRKRRDPPFSSRIFLRCNLVPLLLVAPKTIHLNHAPHEIEFEHSWWIQRSFIYRILLHMLLTKALCVMFGENTFNSSFVPQIHSHIDPSVFSKL